MAKVSSIQSFGTGTYKVAFIPEGPIPRYKAGQFLHLTVDEYDPTGGFWPESRVFSIASASGTSELEIVYSVKGRYTRRMEQELAIGQEIWLKLPYGTFVIDSSISVGQDIVLIGGGTGISPYLPYLMKILNEGMQSKTLKLYYGVRENAMFLAHDLIDACAVAGLVEANLFVENEAPNSRIPSSAKSEQGRLEIERILAESKNLHDPVFFISGPPVMIKIFRAKIAESGIDLDHIKIDEWE